MTNFFLVLRDWPAMEDKETLGAWLLPVYTMRGRVAAGASTKILGTLLSRAFDFGEKGNRIVLDFRAKELGKPGGWESCGSDAGKENDVGNEELVSVAKSDSEEFTAFWERDLKDPKKCDFWGIEGGICDAPSSDMTLVDGVAYEELVVVEDMLGREELPGESRVLERVSPSERDTKCPSTLGRHRHDEGLECVQRSSDRASATGCDV